MSSATSDEMRQRIAALESEIDRLSVELEETNRGVVALYSQLDERAQELRRASEYKSRFLSVVSHELRTPLTSVTNLSRLLLERTDGDLTPEQERQVTLIRDSVASLTEMVNELLDLARIEAGKSRLVIRESRVADLVAGLRGVFRPVLRSATPALVFDEPDPDLTICTDDGKLSQVLRNFISNAVKFTTEGEIRVTVVAADEMLRCAVRDTGVGIEADHIKLIFQDFVQIDNPRQQHVLGTGLGLSLSRKIADLLHGSIGVESTPGVGSTFWIEIPRVHPRGVAGCVETVIDGVLVGDVP
jgi:signal transduction histidine kinase